MDNISVICPTRNRPDNITRFIINLCEKADKWEDLQFISYIDKDDTVSIPAIINTRLKFNIEYKIIRDERVFASKMFNAMYKECDNQIIFNAGDDMIIHNKGWDTKVIEAFEASAHKILMVYGPDGYQPRTFGTHFFIHKNWIKIQGEYIPVELSSDYVDTWYNDIADVLNTKVILDDFGLEHLHPLAGKAKYDSTYIDRILMKGKFRPDIAFDNSNIIKQETIQKLKDYINAKKEK